MRENWLGGLSNQIFASKYTLYIPNKKVLENEVEKVLREYNKKIELKGIQNAGKLSGESNGYTANDVNTASRAILAASTYKVETDVDSTGLINKVTIERVTGSGSSSSSSTQKP